MHRFEPTVSVVVCTYTLDRLPDLRGALASVAPQLRDGDEILVVVDHNLPLLERIRQSTEARVLANESGPGLSGARNTGLRGAVGDVVVFLDDDAAARPGWLDLIRAAFGANDVVALGTAVLPAWDGAAPRWFPEEFGWVVGCGFRGQPTSQAEIRNPIGASMAVRRRAFAVAGGFSLAMGRIGALPVGCEETEFCIRLKEAIPDARIIFEPLAAVDHRVPRSRQTVSYFVRRCFHEGRSKWAVTRLRGTRTGLSAERRYVRRVLPGGVLAGLGTALRRLDSWALARAGMIIIGFAATVLGYLSARRAGVAPPESVDQRPQAGSAYAAPTEFRAHGADMAREHLARLLAGSGAALAWDKERVRTRCFRPVRRLWHNWQLTRDGSKWNV